MERRGRRLVAAAATTLVLAGCGGSGGSGGNVDNPAPSPSPDPTMSIIPCDPKPRDVLILDKKYFAYSLRCGDTAGIVIFKRNSDNSETPIQLEIAPPPNDGNYTLDVSVGSNGMRASVKITNGLFTSGEIYQAQTLRPSS